MEGWSPVVLEISSDEEDGFGDCRKGSGFDVGDADDCDWLSNLLCEVSGNADDDSDDVVLVSEVFPKAPRKSRSEYLKPSDKIVDVKSDDDDCVVLDCDPEKPLAVVNRRVEDDDDLEIVGEKGEVACRDFPHPRHLCAKFPFGSTPHEVHCGQCHCYVCDSLAPCSEWGSGHCHANDKDEYWKAERKRVKKAADKPRPIGPCRIESFFPPTQLPTSLAQHRGFNAHPMSSNISVPNTINQVIHPSGRYKPLGSRNHRSFPAHATVVKQHDFVGGSQNNRGSGNQSLKRCRANQQIHTAGSVISHHTLPSAHSNKVRRETYVNRKFSSSAILSCPRLESNNLVLPRPQPNNLAPSQPVASYHLDAGNALGNQLLSRSMISSHNLENHSTHPQQLIYNPTSNLVNDVQQGNQIQNGTDASSTDFSFFLDSCLDNGNADDSQYQSTKRAETSQFQKEPNSDHLLSVAPLGSLSQQSVIQADYTSPISDGHIQFLESTKPDPLDFQFGSWMFENQPLSEAVDDSISPNWNVFSPEPAFLDTAQELPPDEKSCKERLCKTKLSRRSSRCKMNMHDSDSWLSAASSTAKAT